MSVTQVCDVSLVIFLPGFQVFLCLDVLQSSVLLSLVFFLTNRFLGRPDYAPNEFFVGEGGGGEAFFICFLLLLFAGV